VRERLAVEVAEERPFLREERVTASAEEPGQISPVAVVRPHHRVPGEPVLLP
jgi:hypothetical protein